MPRTLLQLAGVDRRPAAAARSALLLIDMQAEYAARRGGPLALPGEPAATAEARELLRLARGAGLPVIHIMHRARPGAALFDPEGTGFPLLADVEPAPGEAVVEKALPNAFAGTDLLARLRDTGRDALVIAGFMTHMCVSATTRAALDLGLDATVVAAACATRDLPDPTGGPAIPAGEVHRAAVAELADRFAAVVPDAQSWARAAGLA